ncbi:unnamed protein product, partial [Prunus brigantina]
VLASIYKGLKEIYSVDDSRDCATVLPFHYVYGWLEYFDTPFLFSSSEKSTPIMAKFSRGLLAKYFNYLEDRALLRTFDKVKISRMGKMFSECKQLTDENHIPKEDFTYLICPCS